MEMGVDPTNMVETYQVSFVLCTLFTFLLALPSVPPPKPLSVCVCARTHTRSLASALSLSLTLSREQKRDAVPRACSLKRSFSCRRVAGGHSLARMHACC